VKKGVYVAEYYTKAILGYDSNTQSNPPPICSLPAAYVVDVATDAAGNLIDPDGGSRTVSVFRGPAMCGGKLGSFADGAGQPAGAATGTIYVANLQATGKPHGNVSVCTFARALWLYTGCPKHCAAHGPFALQGRSVYGKLDKKNDLFEAADFEYGQVDVYRYGGTSGITYLYSFNDGMTPSGDVEGIAIDPAG